MSDPPAAFEVRLLAQPRYLCAVRAAVEALAKRMSLSGEDARRVVLAVDEALTNVIRHGYGGACDRPITVRVDPLAHDGREGMRIVIEDECGCIDPAKIKGRPLDEVRPGGLGVHIITHVMDTVEYRPREPGPGMRLTMIKLATPAASGAPATGPTTKGNPA